MTDRPEYIRCIRQTHAEHLTESWCGRESPKSVWCFENIDHAVYNRGRLLPCPECLNVIIAKLSAQREEHEPTNNQS